MHLQKIRVSQQAGREMANLALSSLWLKAVAHIFHELSTATVDMAVLPGVLGSHTLRRTVQVRLGSEPLRLHGGTSISTVSLRQFMKYAG